MKRIFIVLVGIILAFSSLALCVACNSGNKDIVIDGIHYRTYADSSDYHVVGCDDDIEVINIPSYVKGTKVDRIDSGAFKDKTNIKEIILADSFKLNSLYWAPFEGCINVEKITSPSCDIMGLFTKYGSGDNNIEHTIPASVKYVYLSNACTEINTRVLYYCKNIQELHIPKSVTKITDGTNYTVIGVNGNKPTSSKFGNLPFIGCEKLTIYCEVESKPSGWGEYWNYIDSENQAPVHWNAY